MSVIAGVAGVSLIILHFGYRKGDRQSHACKACEWKYIPAASAGKGLAGHPGTLMPSSAPAPVWGELP